MVYWFAKVVVPFVRSILNWNWFWYLVRYLRVLFVMILPTVAFMTTDSLRAGLVTIIEL